MNLKDYFDGECAAILGAAIIEVAPDFDLHSYVKEVAEKVPSLELKDRVLVLAAGLRTRLPESYPEAIQLLIRTLGAELAEGEGMFNQSWYLMPVARFVEEYGLAHPEVSLDAIEAITRRHTGEFAIRPFLETYPDQTLAKVRDWALSDSHNVRRLASEGIRSRLPWAKRYAPFIADPSSIIEITSLLIDDPSPYVRTSVANNLNDISKDHPARAVETATMWLQQSNSPRTQWIVKHGLRGLVKAKNEAALDLLGAKPDPRITVAEVRITPAEITIGEVGEITATVTNGTDHTAEIIVDYQVLFLKKNGECKPTTFKLTKLTLEPHETASVSKRQRFKETTTRQLYPGAQALTVSANGNSSELVKFSLYEAATD